MQIQPLPNQVFRYCRFRSLVFSSFLSFTLIYTTFLRPSALSFFLRVSHFSSSNPSAWISTTTCIYTSVVIFPLCSFLSSIPLLVCSSHRCLLFLYHLHVSALSLHFPDWPQAIFLRHFTFSLLFFYNAQPSCSNGNRGARRCLISFEGVHRIYVKYKLSVAQRSTSN